MKNLSDYIDRGDVLFITEELTLVVKTGVYGDDILLFSAELLDLVKDLYFKESDILIDFLYYVKSKDSVWLYKLEETENSRGMSLHYTSKIDNLEYGKTILLYKPNCFNQVVKSGRINKRDIDWEHSGALK